MKTLCYIALTYFCIVILFSSCEDEKTIATPEPSYNNAYGYFPSENDYQWEYARTVTDDNDSTIVNEKLIAIYNKSDSTTTYRAGIDGRRSAKWYNMGERLVYGDSSILIDYKKLNCTEDSLLIREESILGSSGVFIQTFQLCERKYALVEGYEGKACVKTRQINKLNDGTKVIIIRYFGYGVGLVYESKISFDLNENIIETEIIQLISHTF
jgi:hypothetical protein